MRDGFISAAKSYLHRRGPDGFGVGQPDPALTFIHTRLSIIDLALGKQPMSDERGSITYNGEIYNYRELRTWREPHQTRSDTEVLLKGLAHEGTDFLPKADGMFAFGYYDRWRRQLILARDLFGIKPVYYFFDGETLAFASRLQPLMLLSAKEIDRQGFAEYYISRACHAPRTIFCDIHEIRPGEALTFDLDTFSIKSLCRWAPDLIAERNVTDDEEALGLLEGAMKRSIERHLIADVPIAAFLSGGVDSSLITALAAGVNPNIAAFSIGFRNPAFDESHHAAAVCQHLGIKHHIHYCDSDEFAAHLDDWPTVMDDVVADPAAVMVAVIAQQVRDRGYKAVLSGDGADELFGGYNQYARFDLARRIASVGQYAPFLPGLVRAIARGRSRYIQFARMATIDPTFRGTGAIFEPYLLREILSVDPADQATATDLAGALALDWGRRLPDDTLTRTDRATMHASIEARVPFMTRYVWEASAALGPRLLIKGKSQKYILKKLAERYVPRSCLYRKKNGFDLPLAGWLRGPLRDRATSSLGTTWQRDFLRRGAMERVIDDHMNARNDNADKIWAFMLLEENVRRLRSITLASVEATAAPHPMVMDALAGPISQEVA